MTREEHLAWCKKRALEYLDKGDVENAIASMMSDMQKHDETKFSSGSILSAMGLTIAITRNPQDTRRYIEGFN